MLASVTSQPTSFSFKFLINLYKLIDPNTKANIPIKYLITIILDVYLATFNQESINNRYTIPLVKINVKPSIHIFFLSLVEISKLSKKSSIHIAQGLNPSTAPIITDTNNKDTFFAFILPKTGTSYSSLFSF